MKTKTLLTIALLSAVLEAGAPAQFSYVNLTTLHTNTQIITGYATVLGVFTNKPFCFTNLNYYTLGDSSPTAWLKANGNFTYIYDWLLTNEFGIYALTLTNVGGSYISSDGSTLVLNTNGMGGGGGGGTGTATNITGGATNQVNVQASNIVNLASGNYLQKSFGTGNDLTISNTFTLVNTNVIVWNLTAVTIGTAGSYTNCDGSTNSTYTLCQDTNNFLFGYLTNSCTNIYTPTSFTNISQLSLTNPTVNTYLINSGVTNPIVALHVNQLIQDLQNAGLLTNFYAIYPFAPGTPAGDSVNLLGSSYTISWTGFMASTAAHGSWGVSNNTTGSTSFGDTGFNESNFTNALNNFSLSAWVSPCSASGFIGGALTHNYTGSPHFDPDTRLYGDTNASGYVVSGSINLSSSFWNNPQIILPSSGFVSVSRISSSYYMTFAEGTVSNYSLASTSLPTNSIMVGAASHDLYVAEGGVNSIGFFAIGNGLTSGQLNVLTTIVDNYNSWRPTSIAPSYYQLPNPWSAPTNAISSSVTNVLALWRSYTTNSWILVADFPSCGYGGPCFTGPVIMCAPSHQWYVLSSYYTNSPTGSNVCTFCQTH